MKRILSVLLVLMMLFAVSAVSADAQEDEDISDILSPALLDAVASQDGDGTVDIVVYFADDTLCINDMPGWGDDEASTRTASAEYAEYLMNHNLANIESIFSACPGYQDRIHTYKGKTYYVDIDATLIGCCRAWDCAVSDLGILAENPRVKYIDLFTLPSPYPRFDPYLAAVVNAVDPEDWVTVDVTYSGPFKSVDQMPSWPTARGTTEEIQAQIAAARAEYAAYKKEVEAVFLSEAFAGVDVRCLFKGGNMAIAVVKAGDIATVASRDAVGSINYYYNGIPEPQNGDENGNPYLYDKIDNKLADAVAAQQERGEYGTVNVYIDLELDTELMRDMPSWPDYTAAKQEYDAYLSEQSKLYEAAVADITDAIGEQAISHISNVCFEALTATVSSDAVVDLALLDQVRAIRLWEPDELNNNKHYDYDDTIQGTRYRDRLLAQYSDLHGWSQYDQAPLIRYEERVYHMYAPDDKPYAYDWALVEASFGTNYLTVIHSDYVGGRRLYASGYGKQPFLFDIGLYDAEQDRFFDLTEVNFDDYDGLYEEFQRLDLGYRDSEEVFGDADGDGAVTVLDATRIQRLLVGLCPKYNIAPTAADVDRDGSVTILDATRIQRSIAGICTLDGAPLSNHPEEDQQNDAVTAPDTLIVSVKVDEPRSLSGARNTVIRALKDFDVKAVEMLASNRTNTFFRVTLTQMTEDNITAASNALRGKPSVDEVITESGIFATFRADDFEPGVILVVGSGFEPLLKDFDVEEVRLLTPSMNVSIYEVTFREKTKEIVWRALEALEGAPGVQSAEPNFRVYATAD